VKGWRLSRFVTKARGRPFWRTTRKYLFARADVGDLFELSTRERVPLRQRPHAHSCFADGDVEIPARGADL